MHFGYPKYKQNGFAPIIILVGILVIVAIAGGAYYFGKSQSVKQAALPSPNSVVTSQTPQPTAVSQTTSIPSPSSIDETASWKTYTNIKVEYSLQYPSNFTISESDQSLNFTSGLRRVTPQVIITPSSNFKTNGTSSPYPYSIYIEVIENSQNLSINDFISKAIIDPKYNKFTNITIGGVQGEKTNGLGGQGANVNAFVSHNNKIYFIRIDYSDNIAETDMSNLMDRIISTFKFTQ